MKLSATDLLADDDVVRGLRAAYLESDVGGSAPVEQGGFLLENEAAEVIDVVRLPAVGGDHLHYPSCPDGTLFGMRILGTFHTHPNTGAEWQQEPSAQDIRLSVNHPETMGPHQFVISKDYIYHVDSMGEVVVMGETDRLLDL